MTKITETEFRAEAADIAAVVIDTAIAYGADLTDTISGIVDGHVWIIYTTYAHEICALGVVDWDYASDYMPSEADYDQHATIGAYTALETAVQEAIHDIMEAHLVAWIGDVRADTPIAQVERAMALAFEYDVDLDDACERWRANLLYQHTLVLVGDAWGWRMYAELADRCHAEGLDLGLLGVNVTYIADLSTSDPDMAEHYDEICCTIMDDPHVYVGDGCIAYVDCLPDLVALFDVMGVAE